MPMYDYECKRCGKIEERFDYVGKRKNLLKCSCGGRMTTIISTRAKPQVENYYDETLESWITGPGQRKRLMREQGVRERGSYVG